MRQPTLQQGQPRYGALGRSPGWDTQSLVQVLYRFSKCRVTCGSVREGREQALPIYIPWHGLVEINEERGVGSDVLVNAGGTGRSLLPPLKP